MKEPSPRFIVIMIGSSSGMVANASASPTRNISCSGWPCKNPIRGIITEKKMATTTRVFARVFIASWRGVFGCRISWASPEIIPTRVVLPVRATSSNPSPATTRVPAYASAPCAFSCGNDSPVSEDSSIWRLIAETRFPSAATRVPLTSTRRSPGTIFSVGTSVIPLSRITFVFGEARWASDAMAFFARYSVAISTTTSIMMIA